MQAVGEFASGVAHDFNNLLMVVKGHAEMLTTASPIPSRSFRLPPARTSNRYSKPPSAPPGSLANCSPSAACRFLQPQVLDLNDAVAA